MESLAAAILLRAVQEWSDPRKRLEIEEFLESEDFDVITTLLDLDPQNIRRQLRDGSYLERYEQLQLERKIHADYRRSAERRNPWTQHT